MGNLATTIEIEPRGADVVPLWPLIEPLDASSGAGAIQRKLLRVPHIAIHAFYETPTVADAIRGAASDRHMSRAHITIKEGGVSAASLCLRDTPSPQLILIESLLPPSALLAELDKLSEVVDPGTKVAVIGHVNDVHLYRELMRRGVSDYLLAPVDPVSLIAAVSALYSQSAPEKLGRTVAFVGAKGGVGSSTIAHNVGWGLARRTASEVVIADMDLAYGTASLDFKLEAGQGVEEAIVDAGRLDEVLFERLLAKCGDHLSLLRAPGNLDRCYDLTEQAIDPLITIAQASVPFLILDMPHVWNTWARNALVAADEILITAVPDLPNLRNAKNLITFLRQARPHDPPPKLVLNQVGVPKRPEIKPVEFARAVQLDLYACIPFDAHLFGKASNEGQMIAEVSQRAPASKSILDIADMIAAQKPSRSSGSFDLASVFKKIRLRPRTV